MSYLSAFVLEAAYLRWPIPVLRRAGLFFVAAGLFAQTFFLAQHPFTPAAAAGSLLLLAWVLAVFTLFGSLHHRRQAWGVFVLPVVLGLVSFAMLAAPGTEEMPAWLHGHKAAGVIHGLLLLFAAVGISVGFVASVMYLFQARRLRRKLPPLGGLYLLSLERLETMSRRALNIAVPLLTAGLVMGALLLKKDRANAGDWLSIKVLGTIGLWLVGMLLLVMRYAVHVPPRRLAWLSILAFTLLIISLMAVHPFAEGS